MQFFARECPWGYYPSWCEVDAKVGSAPSGASAGLAYVAHTPAVSGGAWHGLREHLEETARIAASFGANFGGADVARLAGRWHDLGKYDPGWQAYLRGQVLPHRSPGRPPDHRRAGALRASEARLTALAFAVAGHHGGMPALADLKRWLVAHRHDPALSGSITQALAAADAEGAPPAKDAYHAAACQPDDPLRFEMYCRLLFSALVDADFLDTEAHLSPEHRRARALEAPTLDAEALLNRLRAWCDRRTSVPSPVQDWREHWRREVVGHASDPPGLFRLALPTGAGKTLTGLEFALAHAVAHGLQRVVMAVPFLTITDQVAQVYREVLGDPGAAGIVLEQHSGTAAMDATAEDDDSPDRATRWARLAAENWDAPIVVTTTVSLGEG